MKTLSTGFLISVFGLAVILASPAEAAKDSKHKKSGAVTHKMKRHHVVASARQGYWGTDVVRAGPLYNGADYLGDDPDPNVRAFIIKDLSGRYGSSY